MRKYLFILATVFIISLIGFVSAIVSTNPYSYNLNEPITTTEAITQFLPVNFTVPAGTIDAGNVSSINKTDRNYLNVSEVGGSPALTIIINFTGVTGFSNIVMRERYEGGSGHTIKIGLFDCDDGGYEEEYPPDITDMDNFAFSLYNVLDPLDHICGDDNNVSLRLRHVNNGNVNHNFFLDYVVLQLGATTVVAQEVDPLALHKTGDVIPTGNFNWGGFNISNVGNITAVNGYFDNIFDGSGTAYIKNNTDGGYHIIADNITSNNIRGSVIIGNVASFTSATIGNMDFTGSGVSSTEGFVNFNDDNISTTGYLIGKSLTLTDSTSWIRYGNGGTTDNLNFQSRGTNGDTVQFSGEHGGIMQFVTSATSTSFASSGDLNIFSLDDTKLNSGAGDITRIAGDNIFMVSRTTDSNANVTVKGNLTVTGNLTVIGNIISPTTSNHPHQNVNTNQAPTFAELTLKKSFPTGMGIELWNNQAVGSSTPYSTIDVYTGGAKLPLAEIRFVRQGDYDEEFNTIGGIDFYTAEEAINMLQATIDDGGLEVFGAIKSSTFGGAVTIQITGGTITQNFGAISFQDNNLTTTGYVNASVGIFESVNATYFNGTYYGDGSRLTGIVGGNSSFNETRTNELYIRNNTDDGYYGIFERVAIGTTIHADYQLRVIGDSGATDAFPAEDGKQINLNTGAGTPATVPQDGDRVLGGDGGILTLKTGGGGSITANGEFAFTTDTSGDGGLLFFEAGIGGSVAIPEGGWSGKIRVGDGGDFDMSSGRVGNPTGGPTSGIVTGGNSGSFTLTGNEGGKSLGKSSTNNVGGDGGGFTLASGDGGRITGGGTSGDGGSILLITGVAGTTDDVIGSNGEIIFDVAGTEISRFLASGEGLQFNDNIFTFYGAVPSDFNISFDGSDAIFNTLGGQDFIFRNGTGYAKLIAHEYSVASPTLNSYDENFLDNLLSPNEMLINGKIDRSILIDGLEKSTEQIKDSDNCWMEVYRTEYCYNLSDDNFRGCYDFQKDYGEDAIEWIVEYEQEECGTKDLNVTNLAGMQMVDRLMISELNEKIKFLEENCVLK